MHNSDSFSIGSYNCRGYNDSKIEFIRCFMSKLDIFLLQEHWLTDSQLSILANIDNAFLCTGVSGFDSSVILSGRPYGGCAIFWRSDLKLKISILKTASRRICAVRMINDIFKILLINVYMPYENNGDNADEFSDHLFAIEQLCTSNIDCNVIVGGDFNVDFSRLCIHSALLRSFCDNLDLHPDVDHRYSSVDYTYNFNMNRFSTLDHFLLSSVLFECMVTSIDVIHDVSNLSDHEPLILILNLATEHNVLPNDTRTQQPRVSWAKSNAAHRDRYRIELSNRLKVIHLPVTALLCQNLHCRDANHLHLLTTYAHDLAYACSTSGFESIPMIGQTHNRIPGWTEYIEPFKQKSVFWHTLWIDCGRPKTGPVADSMRRTRAAYHYAIRRTKRSEEQIVRDRLAHALVSNKNRDFWREVKRIRANKLTYNYAIDGINSPNEIAQLFGEKYSELYSCVSYDHSDMASINDSLDKNLSASGFISDIIITPSEVKSAVSKMKCDKGDVDNILSSDHFVHACDDLFVHISFLFTGLVTHGFLPDFFLRCSIKPIPKGHNQNLSLSDNYRGIAISSLFGKILDNIILIRYRHLLVTSELQFGFKHKHSTQMCTMVLKETISYYVHNNSTVFCTFLDATKAFDRVHYCKLFRLLIDRQIPACIVRILIKFYADNFVKISWMGSESDCFTAHNGVKQGGVLSPVLFCIYIDILFQQLLCAGYGCYIGTYFVGALAYADDIVLVAPTPTAMRAMLTICDNFALTNHICFNAAKSKCVIVHAKRSCRCTQYKFNHESNFGFQINNKELERVNSFKHLGHIISDVFDDGDDILDKRSVFVRQANNVLCYFGHLSVNVKQHLFNSYCTSFFGCELWRLDHREIDNFCTAWRQALRRLWSLPLRTHNELLPLISRSIPVLDTLYMRSLMFTRRCLTHDSMLISFIARQGVQFARAMSPIGSNMIHCHRRYHFSLYDCITGRRNAGHIARCICQFVPDERRSTAEFIVELINLRERSFLFVPDSTFFSRSELSDIILYAATS